MSDILSFTPYQKVVALGFGNKPVLSADGVNPKVLTVKEVTMYSVSLFQVNCVFDYNGDSLAPFSDRNWYGCRLVPYNNYLTNAY